jgi:hypothetical protein
MILAPGRGLTRILALWTEAEELDAVSEDVVTVEIILHTPHKVKRGAVNIVHSAAFYAANVMVGGQIAIESSLLASELQFLYDACFCQQIQVAIHGSQADSREPADHNPIDTRCGGVRSELLQLLQNHLPLLRIAMDWVVFHSFHSH